MNKTYVKVLKSQIPNIFKESELFKELCEQSNDDYIELLKSYVPEYNNKNFESYIKEDTIFDFLADVAHWRLKDVPFRYQKAIYNCVYECKCSEQMMENLQMGIDHVYDDDKYFPKGIATNIFLIDFYLNGGDEEVNQSIVDEEHEPKFMEFIIDMFIEDETQNYLIDLVKLAFVYKIDYYVDDIVAKILSC